MTLHEQGSRALARREPLEAGATELPRPRWRRRLSSVAFVGILLLTVVFGARGTFGPGALGVLATIQLTLLLLLCRWFSVVVPSERRRPRRSRDRIVTAVEPCDHSPRMN